MSRRKIGPFVALVVLLTGCGRAGDDAALPPSPVPSEPAATLRQVPAPSYLPVGDDTDLHLVPVAGQTGPPSLEQRGTARVDVAVSRLEEGAVRAAEGPDERLAIGFPGYTGEAEPPRAVVGVGPVDDPDPLSPGEADFRFGVTFAQDERSSGTEVDNGDNLMQRGLSSDSSQFKVEIDGDLAACHVAGSRGSVTVRAPIRIEPGVWYAVVCDRSTDRVGIEVVVDPAGRAEVHRAEAPGITGELVWDTVRTPVSVGGKLSAAGQVIRRATDQFNGLVGEAFLDIDPP